MAIKNIENIYEQLAAIRSRLGVLETPTVETPVKEVASSGEEEE